MTDTVEKINRSLIQHGPDSNRIYLMKLDPSDMPGILDRLDGLAGERGYTKVFAKVPAGVSADFLDRGYEQEAAIPHFYRGKETVVFLAKFFSRDRQTDSQLDQIQKNLELAESKSGQGVSAPKSDLDFQIDQATPDDVDEMARVYRKVFGVYPFPIDNPDYLLETMKTHVDYFCVREQGRIVALGSCEMDMDGRNVEMTDFATLPDYRGHGLAAVLLEKMEQAMMRREMLTAYTIARALSPGMNITFAKLGYRYAGTLINNTHICTTIESMNVWYKPL